MWRDAVLRCLTGRSDYNNNQVPDSQEVITALQAKLKVYYDKELKVIVSHPLLVFTNVTNIQVILAIFPATAEVASI